MESIDLNDIENPRKKILTKDNINNSLLNNNITINTRNIFYCFTKIIMVLLVLSIISIIIIILTIVLFNN
jgi:hypothetical protein